MKKIAEDIILNPVYQRPQSYEVQFLRYGVKRTEFFVILGHFMDIFKKKVVLGDIAEIEKSQIFVLFENVVSYEDFFAHKCFKSCYRYFV